MNAMYTKVKEFIAAHQGNKTLFVLKGYPVAQCGQQPVDLAHVIEDKVRRMMDLAGQPGQPIAFEEFLCLYDFLVSQYGKIYIIENPAYHAFYPVNALLKPEVSAALLAHFDQDAEEDVEIGDLSEYTRIYGNVIKIKDEIVCCYNYDDSDLNHEKIERRVIPNLDRPLSKLEALPEGYEYRNLCTEADYYKLTQLLCQTEGRYAVSFDHYEAGKESIRPCVQALNALYEGRLGLYTPERSAVKSSLPPEVAPLMEKYWGYSSFRDLKTYDVDALQQGEKRVQQVSQGQIVSDLIEQAERCVRGENFRDLFVTAPTGSGKSLMFQLPAMYLAEKYDLVTLVITPLIGLMNDQVQILNEKGYAAARTINSDISPILKEEILEEVASGKCNILYLSPESLLSRSDVQQLIGPRKIGMVVVDEAHIVTTWGKQFRPDYWYLGDHVQKLRRAQLKREQDPMPFVVATFTATAIYEGKEDMYHETINSLQMIDPITYLGYVKRDNIKIQVNEAETKRNKTEYELDKFDSLISMINLALARNQKTLIYFPTVALINRFYAYCCSKGLEKYVAKYHGQMKAEEKNEAFQAFRDGEKMVMAATKAFGMGIDIPDIAIVSHYAPTGNVCDYMQEIGRAARDHDIQGQAIYSHMSNDFQHINRLHGLSTIRRYQLVEVIKKVYEIYVKARYQDQRRTKRRNGMLVDTESFSYIFGSPTESNDLTAKVKTAMLLIQKDYESRGFAPFYMRPIPVFSYGYFAISPQQQQRLNAKYGHAAELVDERQNVCKVNLQRIWERDYERQMSFPKFKYLLYTKSPELKFGQEWGLTPAMSIDIFLDDRYEEKYHRIIGAMKSVSNESACSGVFMSLDNIVEQVAAKARISKYHAESIVNVILATMKSYQIEFSRRMNTDLFRSRPTQAGKVSYSFNSAVAGFYRWLEQGKGRVLSELRHGKLYAVNSRQNACKEITSILGVFESMGMLRFQSLGGSNSQLYIYVNETKTMQMVKDRPESYRNRLLEMVESRHKESVRMMSFLFQSHFSSDEIWDHLENYFLGILPPALREEEESLQG